MIQQKTEPSEYNFFFNPITYVKITLVVAVVLAIIAAAAYGLQGGFLSTLLPACFSGGSLTAALILLLVHTVKVRSQEQVNTQLPSPVVPDHHSIVDPKNRGKQQVSPEILSYEGPQKIEKNKKAVGKDPMSYRAAIFKETRKAYTQGSYVNRHGSSVSIDNEPMLNGTREYGALSALSSLKALYKTRFSVIKDDTLNVLLARKTEGFNPVGINMANAYTPGGGVINGCSAQEESICRRTNHYLALSKQTYPLKELGGIYCPEVQVFRQDQNCEFAFMDEPHGVALIAIAAYDLRSGSKDRTQLNITDLHNLTLNEAYINGTKHKIRNMLRTISEEGHTSLVLGALGCGAFENPPQTMANLFHKVFEEAEFKNRFERVDFAILEMSPKDLENVTAFQTICDLLN